jgi:uncharacterized surface protein with fasciclin (FAS1) repeats
MEKNDSLQLSLWVELLKHSGLYNSLNLAGSFTCFVPDNNAMNAYLATVGKQKVSDLPVDAAKNLVKYHTPLKEHRIVQLVSMKELFLIQLLRAITCHYI